MQPGKSWQTKAREIDSTPAVLWIFPDSCTRVWTGIIFPLFVDATNLRILSLASTSPTQRTTDREGASPSSADQEETLLLALRLAEELGHQRRSITKALGKRKQMIVRSRSYCLRYLAHLTASGFIGGP